MVSMTKAKSPITRISKVSFVTNWFCTHAEGNGDSKKQGDQICQNILGCVGQGAQDAAFPDQVAEHEKSNQRNGLRCYQPHDYSNYNGKSNFMVLETDFGLYSM